MTRYQTKLTTAILGAVLVLGQTGCNTPCDYGDAPDGGPTGFSSLFATTAQYPTLDANNGAHVADSTGATLGPTASVESDANDPNDTDGIPNLSPDNTDSDDGIVNFAIALVSIPPPASMTVNVTTPATEPAEQYWINALIDLNMDGEWGGVAGAGRPEWVVRNFPVQTVPGQSLPVRLPPFFYASGNRLPDRTWMRVLLSKEFVSGSDWDGTGSFSMGEVEDHLLELPSAIGGGGDTNKSCIPVAEPDRQNYFFGSGNGPIPVRITVSNIGATPCAVRLTLTRVNGNVVLNGNAGPIVVNIPVLRPGMPQIFNFQATVPNPRNLPSIWNVRAAAVDPPTVITPKGVIIGYGDSVQDIAFFGSKPVVDENPKIEIQQQAK